MPIDISYASPDERIAWHDSDERKQTHRVAWRAVYVILIALPIVAMITYWYQGAIPGTTQKERLDRTLAAVGVAVGLWFYMSVLFLQYRRSQFRLFRDRRNLQEAKAEVVDAESQLTESADNELGLASLWSVTAKRLDYYHEIATQQANSSFARAQSAMIAGFGILVLSLALSLFSKTATSSVAIAVVGGLSAALGGYVGRTFIKSQESASGNLKGYFLQPLELSRFLFAERLLQELPDDRRPEGVLKILEGITRQSGGAAPGDKAEP